MQLENIYFSYPDRQVFSNLSREIKQGEHHLLESGNGTGKSTFLRLVAGLLTPVSGTVRIQGESPLAWSRGGGRLGWVPASENSLPLELTGEECLKLFVGRHEAQIRLKPVWELPGVHECFATKVKNCSSGMKRIIQWLCALELKPDLLLLDEPFQFLSSELQVFFKDELSRVSATVILARHPSSLQDSFSRDFQALENSEGPEAKKYAPDSGSFVSGSVSSGSQQTCC